MLKRRDELHKAKIDNITSKSTIRADGLMKRSCRTSPPHQSWDDGHTSGGRMVEGYISLLTVG
jgi:hypothetical protein